MPWSKWKPLDSENVKEYAPDKSGAYRIALPDNKFFAVFKDEQDYYWLGIVSATECKDIIYTDIVYLGMTEDQTIKDRLLQHLGSPNGVIRKLRWRTKLFFKFLSSDDAGILEVNQYKDFVSNHHNACPPGDGNSNQCSEAGGVYLKTYIRSSDGKLRFLC